ncbi:methylated-DNA--[protein]-cysteine S-methyltransferase [Chitinimonas sp. BJYL2]|uniref:methylated-DNA--[protein]-cysteine S-methyltransferase n=1 Tax=Chitinimonas sp. BJYL2 TaxID=2976696 RepID=UPI0022B39A3A|nr:methylated-DNA--[protein]-cysteine S-methyltransferase [Chitinimonas sp. BJYL2]
MTTPTPTPTPAPADLPSRAQAYDTVARALVWLREHALDQPSLTELSAELGLSEFHLQRVFAEWAGVSPKRFLQHLSRERARAALRAGEDVLGAAMDAGLSGPGRLHDLMVSCEAATPGEIRNGGAGMVIRWGIVATPLGQALLADSARGLVKLAFIGTQAESAVAELQHDWPRAELVHAPEAAQSIATRLFTRYRQPEPVHLFVKGTQFQLKVWEALLRVPEGRLTSYGELAGQMGAHGAARAVGSAVGANPIALLIPCHRVIRSDGALGGYRWGEVRKQAILGLELARHGIEERAA